MYETYNRIFKRVGLKRRVVLADTGAIGGSASHQFMAIQMLVNLILFIVKNVIMLQMVKKLNLFQLIIDMKKSLRS